MLITAIFWCGYVKCKRVIVGELDSLYVLLCVFGYDCSLFLSPLFALLFIIGHFAGQTQSCVTVCIFSFGELNVLEFD